MRTAQRLIVILLATAGPPLAFAAQPTVFDVTGSVAIVSNGTEAPTGAIDAFSGTIDINTATGAVTGADLSFGSPGFGLTIPALTFAGLEIAPGPTGSHLYTLEFCAAAVCSSNWLMGMTIDVTPTVPTLVGYAGGKIDNVGLFYGGVQNTWGGCPDGPVTACGGITLKSGGGGGKTGVPEPASALLMLLGLAATQLRRQRSAS
jgi:hypothetical protein